MPASTRGGTPSIERLAPRSSLACVLGAVAEEEPAGREALGAEGSVADTRQLTHESARPAWMHRRHGLSFSHRTLLRRHDSHTSLHDVLGRRRFLPGRGAGAGDIRTGAMANHIAARSELEPGGGVGIVAVPLSVAMLVASTWRKNQHNAFQGA